MLLILPHAALEHLMSHCRIVTINLNNAMDVKAVFVCCESELTRDEKRFLPFASLGAHYFSSPFFSSWKEIDLEQRLNSSSKS